ncbi:MAG: toll/interleukin-1 receptor domain-containing protein [Ferruginibacter sp.]
MKLLSQLTISRSGEADALIQLLQGDLAEMPAEHKTDILVVSAFPGSYQPIEGTLIGALDKRGLSVETLSKDKDADLREQLSCWLSKPLSKEAQAKFNFRRIICFEPGVKIKESNDVVCNIFRCINTFAFDEKNNVIAMPMVASGNQRASPQDMLPALMEAAQFWLQNGLPLQCIKLVIYREEEIQMSVDIFENFKQSPDRSFYDNLDISSKGAREELVGDAPESIESIEDLNPPAAFSPPVSPPSSGAVPPPPAPVSTEVASDQYDYFISYAHTHAALVNEFVDQLKQKNNDVRIFYDRDSIPPGGLWIKQLSAAIQKAKKVLVFLSPDYDNSMVCWDEFQCAKLMEYNRKKQIIQTIYLYNYKDVELPPIMGIYSYIDCREGDPVKLNSCVDRLLQSLI